MFENTLIDQSMFTTYLFTRFDETPHPTVGRIVVSNTFILERFFLVLANNNKDAKLKTSRLKEEICRIYKKP